MPDYAFQIGQMVDYRPSKRLSSAAHGPYEILQRLPHEGGELRCRIKSPHERHERVVDGSELTVV
jgi:hypothetical protein